MVSSASGYPNDGSDLERWRNALEVMATEYDQLVQQGRWISGPSDLLGVLGRARRELDHSRMLAWLLHPAGAHGFRDAFLRAILSECYPAEHYADDNLVAVTIRREINRLNSRADIVAVNQRLTVVIEVKVDASEQTNQCRRLHQDWSDEPDPHWIFLTREGRKPITATDGATDAFRTLSFRTVRAILERLVEEHAHFEADSAGWRTARAYLDTLSAEFG